MLAVLFPYIVVVGVSLWLNRLDVKQCRARFDLIVDGTPLMLVSVLYSVMVVSTGRPLFSGVLVLGGALLLFAVNRLKLSQFKEPLVFVDFGLFAQMIRHPRFYFPYIFPLPVVGTVAFLIAVMALLYWLQPPLTPEFQWLPRIMFAFVLLPVVFALCCYSGGGKELVHRMLARRKPTFDPNTDFENLGLTGSLLVHSLAHIHREGKDGKSGPMLSDGPSPHCVWSEDALAPISEPKPHVVLVQAESFFDIRRIDDTIDKSIFANYDRLSKQGLSGQMEVAAHGAYTMRTEFSVLTGIPNNKLGTDCMNPYLMAAQRPVWSLAHHYKSQGYRCICVHPYDLKFFRRDKVMPNLGFDELHGEGVLERAKRYGPYVSDEAVAEHVISLLDNAIEPLFIFAITVEAHGPWEDGRFDGICEVPGKGRLAEEGEGPLSMYLRHLSSADEMLEMMGRHLSKLTVCRIGFYGDHIGSIPNGKCGRVDTDYIVWGSGLAEGSRQKIKCEEMGELLLSKGRM
ncbi:conserved membrane protein of unknown function [Pseudodesulfovibrio profundus]|uniref:Sulfatase N-terminal domain-containing protein n=1 Tax=Pseudodesulfovibrio profundus TaxID=57320 RepID=A0A2C8FDU4_9BACT|nr:LTA synthase family protein [Pseudodesulfovibrio profundus]SOB60064.1 conserved membrane protein of unknown function [Pseudodesulfovibrio profundus]